MKSGNPGGIINALGAIRVTGSPGSSRSRRYRYATACRKPANGSATSVISRSHFTCAIPYHPGTTKRSGQPCCGGSGAPFMSYATDTSGSGSLAVHTAVGGLRR